MQEEGVGPSATALTVAGSGESCPRCTTNPRKETGMKWNLYFPAGSQEGAGVLGGHAERVPPSSLRRGG